VHLHLYSGDNICVLVFRLALSRNKDQSVSATCKVSFIFSLSETQEMLRRRSRLQCENSDRQSV